MNKITSIKIKYADGSYSGQIPISVLAKNISWDDDGHDITDAIGDVDINATGSLQDQINKKVNTTDLSDYVNGQLAGDVANWLNTNVNPAGSAVIVDKTLSIQGAAADAQSVREIFSTKEEVNELASTLAGEIKWQVPQGAFGVYPVTVSGNKITVNGTIITPDDQEILRIIIYGSKLLYTTKAPTYDRYKNIYFEPITSFTPGNIIKANINLVSGTYTASKAPYLDLRTINSNTDSLYLHVDGVEAAIDEQPEMIAFGLYEGEYDNAVFEFSIVDVTKIESNPIINTALEKIKQLDQILLNNNENIIFDIEGSRTVSYSTSKLKGSLDVVLNHNIFAVNGSMKKLSGDLNSIIYLLISPSENNSTAIPTYTTDLNNFQRAYDGIPLKGFQLNHKYSIKLKLISGNFTLQSTDTSSNVASDLFIQLRNMNGDLLFNIPNIPSILNSTEYVGEWVCNELPDCALLGLRSGIYENAVFQIIIKDLTIIENDISSVIKKSGLINISNTGMWLQGAYDITNGTISNSVFNKRIHWCGLLPKKTRYIQFESPYQISLYGWDEDYNVQGYLNSWEINTSLFWQKIIDDTKQEKYFINMNKVKQYFSNIKYFSMTARLKTDEIIDQTHGSNIKVYVEPDAVPFMDNYIFTEEDFSVGYFSPTYNKNIYNNANSRKYLTSAKFIVHAGDEIEGILDPESNLGFFILILESNLQENNKVYRSNSGHKYLEDFNCHFYKDSYCEISIYAEGQNLFPTSLGNNKIILHRNKKDDFEKINLLIQSRYFDERSQTDSQGNLTNPQPLTLLHFSDNHGSNLTLNKIQELLKNQDYVDNVTTSGTRKMFNIDDVINTGDAIYSYYGYTVDGVAVKDFYDESVSYLIGDYIVYDNTLYQCTENTTGAFNVNHWNLISNDLSGTPQIGRKQYLEHQIGKKSLFVLGNHDTNVGDFQTSTGITTTKNRWHALSQRDAYDTFFASQKDEWGVIQTEGKCYWYKDYQDAKIRLIGIDMSYWDTDEFNWLSGLLAEADNNNYSVILASHSQLSSATGNSNITFQSFETLTSAGKYRNSQNYSYGTYPDKWQGTAAGESIDNLVANKQVMDLLQSYKDIIICHLHGHWHIDMFEYYDDAPDILTIGVDQGGAFRAVYEAERTRSLPNWYVFNVITFDTYNKLIKIVRFGNDIDHYLRSKKVLTYDYANKRIITNY